MEVGVPEGLERRAALGHCGAVTHESAGRPLDFFISDAGVDEDWATWIGEELEIAGYTVELDVWNWAAGTDVIEATERALERASRVLEVWTPDYFTRVWPQMEHRVTFAATQTKPGLLLPVLVRPCSEALPRLYRTLKRVDLVGLEESEARDRLLEAGAGPSPPTSKAPFPGVAAAGSFPGRLPEVWNVPPRDPFFTGRESMLEEMFRRLAKADPAVALVAEQGEGGVGKSALAAECARAHAAEFGLVWWVEAGPHGTGEAGLLELAALLHVPAFGGAAAVLPALVAELGHRPGWLLVLDGVARGEP